MILKQILKVCGVAFLGCLIICLATLPFVFNQDNQVGQHKIVCADTVTDLYSYSSSNWYVSLSRYTGTTPDVSSTVFDNFEITFDLHSDSSVTINFWLLGNSLQIVNSVKYLDNFTFGSWQYFDLNWYGSAWNYVMHYFIDTGFNSNVSYVRIQSMPWGGTNTSIAVTRISFFDTNGNRFAFEFFVNYNASNSNGINLAKSNGILYYTDRTYFLTNALTDNENYIAGYNQGQAAGESIGFSNGYNVGYNRGHIDGYADGQEDPGAYSLSGLVSSVVMAPVNIFKSIFDFDILGFNMLDLVTGLITFAVVVLVIKFIIGGGGK